jgi:hypothetical protein
MALISKDDDLFGTKSNTERSFSSWLKERRLGPSPTSKV